MSDTEGETAILTSDEITMYKTAAEIVNGESFSRSQVSRQLCGRPAAAAEDRSPPPPAPLSDWSAVTTTLRYNSRLRWFASLRNSPKSCRRSAERPAVSPQRRPMSATVGGTPPSPFVVCGSTAPAVTRRLPPHPSYPAFPSSAQLFSLAPSSAASPGLSSPSCAHGETPRSKKRAARALRAKTSRRGSLFPSASAPTAPSDT